MRVPDISWYKLTFSQHLLTESFRLLGIIAIQSAYLLNEFPGKIRPVKSILYKVKPPYQ